MPSIGRLEAAKLAQDELVAGIIEEIITVNEMFELLPFDSIDGNALAYNRENALGPVATFGVGDQIGVSGQGTADQQAAKTNATFTQVTSTLTTIMGDAEVNGLVQATQSGDGNDQTSTQIASKAKSAGRKYQDMLINGTGAADEFEGLIALCAASQEVNTGTDGSALSFEILDNLMDLVLDKDGSVDYFTMPARTRRAYRALLRSLGGTNPDDIFEMPSGQRVIAYSGIPVLRNDYIPINQTKGSSSNTTTIFAGTLDDGGTRQQGLAGLTAANAVGIAVVDVGESETRDERIWRVKWYSGLALFSEKGLACAPGITN